MGSSGSPPFQTYAPEDAQLVERLEAREDSLAVIVYGNEHAISLFTRRRRAP